MKLSPRLKAVADFVAPGSVVADVGTDHAYIPIYLISKGISPRAIATDVKEGPLSNAMKNIKYYGFESLIETRLGYGLEPLKYSKFDVLIIAGMGGILTIDILENGYEIATSCKNIILQPMNAQEKVRKWLHDNSLKIKDEKLAKEYDKIYEILFIEKGSMDITDDIYYEVGYSLIKNKDPLLPEFIHGKIRKYTQIIESLSKLKENENHKKLKECEEKIFKLKEVLRCL